MTMPACGQSRNSGSVKELLEKFERGVFMRVTLHVEIDEGADLFRAAQDGAQLGREVSDRVLRVGRIHLRIERGDFDRKIHDREKLGVFAERIGPAAGLRARGLRAIPSQRAAYSSASCSLTTASPSKSTVNPILLSAPLAQRFHHVVRIFPGDELPRHAGNVPAQNVAR